VELRPAAADTRALGAALQTKSFGSVDLWQCADPPASIDGNSPIGDLFIQSVHPLRKDAPQLIVLGSGVIDKIDPDEQVYSLVQHLS